MAKTSFWREGSDFDMDLRRARTTRTMAEIAEDSAEEESAEAVSIFGFSTSAETVALNPQSLREPSE